MLKDNAITIRIEGKVTARESQELRMILCRAAQYIYDNKIEMPVSIEFVPVEVGSTYFPQTREIAKHE